MLCKILKKSRKMSELTINDLPTELIAEILERAGQNSLKNAILTCSLWKEIIESSRSWSLVLHHETNEHRYLGFYEPWVDFLLTTNRKFHTIRIDHLNELGKNCIIEIFKRLGRSVVKLIIKRSCLDKCDLFIEMLKFLPNLEHFIICLTYTKWNMSDIPPESDLPELKKLRTLETIVCEQKIINCCARSQLKTIKFINFSGYRRPREDPEYKPIIDLLKHQNQLTTLALRAIYHDTFELFHTDVLAEPMPFQLTKLSLLDFELRQTPNDFNNLLKFMKLHMHTIRELELGRKFPKFIYEFVFENFKNLKSLQMRINELPDDMNLEEIESIDKLILIDFPPLDHGCPPSLKELLSHAPNITDLTLLENDDRETVHFIASTLTKVNKLNVNNFTGSMYGDVQFPKLTSLNIHKLHDRIDWGKFTDVNSGIIELTIEFVLNECLDLRAIEEITENVKLKTLKIGKGFCTDKHFYDIICRNCLDLKILALHKSCVIDGNISGLGYVPGLRFYDKNVSKCCDGLQIWNRGQLPDDRGSEYQLLTTEMMNVPDDDDYDTEDDFDDEDDIDTEDDVDAENDFDPEHPFDPEYYFHREDNFDLEDNFDAEDNVNKDDDSNVDDNNVE